MTTRRSFLTASAVLLASQAHARELPPGFATAHPSEPHLLHRQIDAAMLHSLKVWDTRLADWQPMRSADEPRAPVLVLHFWADWCAPCREEFPTVRELVEETSQQLGDRVQWIMLSETPLAEAMRSFLEKHRDRMPRTPIYLDVNETLANVLRQDLVTSFPYPLTILCDAQRVVRQALAGSITRRRDELRWGLRRLAGVRDAAK